MANDRTYTIVESGTNSPPRTDPALRYKGNQIGAEELITFNKNKDNMRKSDHYRIRFDIKSFNQSDLRITANKDDMLWVKKGTGPGSCPKSYCNDLPETIWVDAWDENGEWIEVVNMDMAKQEFWFTINLVDKRNPTSTNYVPLDPGGGNENGGSIGNRFEYRSMAIGLATGAAVGIGAVFLATGGFVAANPIAFVGGSALVGLIVGFAFDRFSGR